MSCVRTFATLRVVSEQVSPDLIGQMLGVACTSARPRDTDSRYRHRREQNYWAWSTEDSVDSREFGEHLAQILAVFGPRSEQLEALRRRGCSTDIFCYWESNGQGGPGLDLDELQALSRLELPITWDIYFDADEEDS